MTEGGPQYGLNSVCYNCVIAVVVYMRHASLFFEILPRGTLCCACLACKTAGGSSARTLQWKSGLPHIPRCFDCQMIIRTLFIFFLRPFGSGVASSSHLVCLSARTPRIARSLMWADISRLLWDSWRSIQDRISASLTRLLNYSMLKAWTESEKWSHLLVYPRFQRSFHI